MVTNLADLPAGKRAVIVRLRGGHGLMRKLEALGLRAGKQVYKLSSQLMAGPVVLLVDGREMAMGRGIARRIQVEVQE